MSKPPHGMLTSVVVHDLFTSGSVSVHELLDFFNSEHVSEEEKIATLFRRDEKGRTLLFHVVKENRSFALIQRMLEIGGKELVLAAHFGQNVLHEIFSFSSTPFKVFKIIAEVGGPECLKQQDEFYGNTPIHHACFWEENRDSSILMDIARMAPDALLIENNNHQVARSKDFKTQMFLNKIGGEEYEQLANESFERNYNLTLFQLVKTNSIELASDRLNEESLSSELFEVDEMCFNPLITAILYCGQIVPALQESYLKLIRGMIDGGGRPLILMSDKENSNALHFAASYNAPLSVIKMLVERGGKEVIESRNIKQNTPLHNACEAKAQPEIIKYLAQNGDTKLLSALNADNFIPLGILYEKDEPSGERIMALQDAWYESDPNFCESIPQMSIEQSLRWADTIDPSLMTTNRFLKSILNDQFIDAHYLGVIMIDLYVQIAIAVVLAKPDIVYDRENASNGIIVMIFGLIWIFAREVAQLVATPLEFYIRNSGNLIDIAHMTFLVCGVRLLSLGEDYDSFKYRLVMTLASAFVWLEMLFIFGRLSYGVSVLTTALGEILYQLLPFAFTTIVIVTMFSFMFFSAEAGDGKICFNDMNLTSSESWSCLGNWGLLSFEMLLTQDWYFIEYENWEGVEKMKITVSLTLAVTLGIFLLNILIAVVSTVFAQVRASSENAFWATRLEFMSEVNITRGYICGSRYVESGSTGIKRALKSFDQHDDLEKSEPKSISRQSFSRYDDDWVRNECLKEDMDFFFKWWFYLWKFPEKPSLRTRLFYFYTRSDIKEIIFPGNVFSNILTGNKYSEEVKGVKGASILFLSYLHFLIGIIIIVIIFFLGLAPLGLLWPRFMKEALFFGPVELKKENKPEEDVLESKIELLDQQMNELQKQNMLIMSLLRKLEETNDMSFDKLRSTGRLGT